MPHPRQSAAAAAVEVSTSARPATGATAVPVAVVALAKQPLAVQELLDRVTQVPVVRRPHQGQAAVLERLQAVKTAATA
jgi:hypothetical protein